MPNLRGILIKAHLSDDRGTAISRESIYSVSVHNELKETDVLKPHSPHLAWLVSS